MKKVVVGLVSMLVSVSVKAADFTVELVPGVGSVNSAQVGSISISKISNLQTELDSKLTSSSVIDISKVNNLQAELNSKVSAASVIDQSGSIMAFAGPCPTGTLLTNGASVSRGTYAKLFSKIGVAHGSADASSFNLPDYRGRFLRMMDGGAGRDAQRASRLAMNPGGATGDAVGSVQDDENKEHTHNTQASGSGEFLYVRGSGGYYASMSPSGGNIDRTTQPIAQAGGPESRPKNANINYCIVY